MDRGEEEGEEEEEGGGEAEDDGRGTVTSNFSSVDGIGRGGVWGDGGADMVTGKRLGDAQRASEAALNPPRYLSNALVIIHGVQRGCFGLTDRQWIAVLGRSLEWMWTSRAQYTETV